MTSRKKSDIEIKETEKERDLKELYDKSFEMGKTMTMTEVSKKINLMGIKNLNTYKIRLFESCSLLKLPPPEFRKTRKLPKKFTDTVRETEKTKLKRVLIPQGVFEFLELNTDDKILFELDEVPTSKKKIKLKKVTLKKYDLKRDGEVGLDISETKKGRPKKKRKYTKRDSKRNIEP